MRKKLSLSVIILLIVSSLASIGISCGSATATPTGTFNAWLDAVADQNSQAVVTYESEDLHGMTSAQRVEAYDDTFEGIESYSITNRNIVVESETATTATVSASFNVSTTDTDGTTREDAVDQNYYLTKVDGKWLISDLVMARGENEARKTEKMNIMMAVIAMMAENSITSIPNPHNVAGGVAYNDMTVFPDNTSVAGSADKLIDGDSDAYNASDKNGYLLWSHDRTADGSSSAGLVNYVPMSTSTYYYTCEADGTVRQWSDAAMTTEHTD